MHPSSLWRKLGRIFLTGLLTVLPLVATIYFTVWEFGVRVLIIADA